MRVYLDYNATTPVDPEVLDAMLPYFADSFGNASSIHSSGQRARSAVDAARESVASLIGAKSSEIVFTSGGTEADNLAVFGMVDGGGESDRTRKHVVTTAIEHHAVLNAAQSLEKRGVEVTYVPVDRNGIVDPQEIAEAIRPETVLISVMHANNELGTVQPIEEIGQIAAEADVYFHSDGVQSAGKIPLDVNKLRVDLLSLSAHKIYGPKGVGALYVRSGSPLQPQFFGGHHERDRRPGTENVPGIVGFGKAAELAKKRLAEDIIRMGDLRNHFERSVTRALSGVRVNGSPQQRLANTSNLDIAGISGESFVIALDLLGISCSTGAACSSGSIEPSHVLLAIGLTPDEARSSIRFSLGRTTTEAEINYAIECVQRVVERIRAVPPVHTTAVPVR
jgi:cysteine desulfurase